MKNAKSCRMHLVAARAGLLERHYPNFVIPCPVDNVSDVGISTVFSKGARPTLATTSYWKGLTHGQGARPF